MPTQTGHDVGRRGALRRHEDDRTVGTVAVPHLAEQAASAVFDLQDRDGRSVPVERRDRLCHPRVRVGAQPQPREQAHVIVPYVFSGHDQRVCAIFFDAHDSPSPPHMCDRNT